MRAKIDEPRRIAWVHQFLLSFRGMLWIDAANLRSFSNTRNSQHIGSQAHITRILIGLLSDSGKGAIHNHFELADNLINAPEEALKVLHPFEVAYSHAPGIGQNVRNDNNTLLEENFICFRSSGTISSLSNNAGLDAVSVSRRDNSLGSGRNQDVARNFQRILHAYILGLREVNHAPLFLFVTQHIGRIKAGFVINTPTSITNGNNLTALVMEEARRNRASITVALNAHPRALQRHSHAFSGLASDKQHTGCGRVVTAFTSSNRERFAGDYGGDGVSFMHGVRIHYPCHHLRVCIDIRRGNIAMRSNNDRYFGRIAASHALQLGGVHILGVADDTTFGTAKGNTDDGAFPGHPHSQRLDLVE